jgi:hypothetical protein
MFYAKLCVWATMLSCKWFKYQIDVKNNKTERNGWCNKRKLARWKECGESKVHLVAVHNVMLSHVISCFSRMLFFSMEPFVALHGLVDCCIHVHIVFACCMYWLK